MKILLVILALGLFFRIYNFESLYTFDHDQDLSAWIVRDIIVNHHPRLIGQLTSIDSVFIGPLYYYVLAFFFAIFKMNPLSAHIPATLIGLATIASIYFVFSKLFTKTTGLVGAFFYATSISLVTLDRWIVPTLPTVLWSVWLLHVVLNLLKGNFKVLPIAGLLIGLIWHIHVGLLPLVFLIPAAILMSGKRPKFSKLIIPAIIIIFLSLPIIVFETRHNFMQSKGFYQALSYVREDQPTGLLRLKMVLPGASSALSRTIFPRTNFPYSFVFLSFILL
ncbi:MAG: glycosyltransferase family 39 protein, partial [Candidatus Curtissbacteria bacterium]|nr:glycosyltransferase family 39 protein [Candidatus Curtissbacteria bacterium]